MLLSFSLRAAAFAAAICCRSAADEEEAGFAASEASCETAGALVALAGGAKASPSAGLSLPGRAERVLLVPAFVGEGALGDGGTAVFELCSFVWKDVLTLRHVPPGVKPKPPRDVRVAGFADADGLLPIGKAGFAKLPSLVPGLL